MNHFNNLIRSNKFAWSAVIILLTAMTVLAVTSMWNDAAIMDEVSHIPAGYSYVSRADMRINAEHPPLVKDLAGVATLAYSKISGDPINFPEDSRPWQNELNSQWRFGFDFLYGVGNNVDSIVFWSRIPAILIMLILGFYIFKWTKELYGNRAGLFALFFYSLSPTILAHGRFVTTDVPAATGIFIATYYFIKALKDPGKKNIIIGGIVLGLALLTKFSTFLLLPLFVLITIIYIISLSLRAKRSNPVISPNFAAGRPLGSREIASSSSLKARTLRNNTNVKSIIYQNVKMLILIFIIGAAVLYPFYQFHVWNYPPSPASEEARTAALEIDDCDHLDIEKYPVNQFRDAVCILKTYGEGDSRLVDMVVWMTEKPILRSYGQYMLGLLMVNQRAVGGNTTYFLGDVSRVGWKSYFPIVYLIKVPIAFLIAIFLALSYALTALVLVKLKYSKKMMKLGLKEACKSGMSDAWKFIPHLFWTVLRTINILSKQGAGFIAERPGQVGMLIFIAMYWVVSVSSPLNIGIRHILPTVPFIYVLVSGSMVNIIQKLKIRSRKLCSMFYVLCFVLIAWYAYANASIFPSYLAYFNEFIGGAKNGYMYVVDSNLDWGQDLKRLAAWVEENNVDKIKVDYFGGGRPQYYLGDKYEFWWGMLPEEFAKGSWLAVSATFLQGGRGVPIEGYDESTTHYDWLNKYEPVTVIGHSIFVYDLTEK